MILKLKKMREKKVPIRWTIIDCGWSDAEDYALSSFDADKVRFPNGLKGCVEKIKKINMLRNNFSIGWAAKEIYTGLEASITINFNGNMIFSP